MSKYDEEDFEEINVLECDCCHSSMDTTDLAYDSSEDQYEIGQELMIYIHRKKYHKLCHQCMRQMRREAFEETLKQDIA